MPTAALLYGTGLVTSTAYPYSITIGSTEVAVANAELESIEFEENGDDDPGYCRLRLLDLTNSLPIDDLQVVRVHDNTLGTQVFLGTVIRHTNESASVGRYIDVEAVSASAMLDEIMVPLDARPVESDQARVSYLWGVYAKYPLDPYVGNVAQTNAATSADLVSGMSLRAALTQTAGLAGSSTRFFVNSLGQLVWRSGDGASAAPYNINVAVAPGGGAIAPQSLRITRDGLIKNRVYIRGANADGSGWYADTASLARYGPREEFIDAPSSDTAAKAQTIAQLQLGKVASPNIRASFETDDPNSGWRADQNVTVTSAADDLSAETLRIVKVTTSFWRGDGKRHYRIDAGKTGARLSGIPTAQTFVPPSVGQPAFDLRGQMRLITSEGELGGTISGGTWFGPTGMDLQAGSRLSVTSAGLDYVIGERKGGMLSLGPGGSVGVAPPNLDSGEVGSYGFNIAYLPLGFFPTEQAITSVGDTIQVDHTDDQTASGGTFHILTPDANYTLTSTPTIAEPSVGIAYFRLLVLIGAGTFTTTVQDRGTLPSSNLYLGAATRAIGPGDSLMLLKKSGVGWYEIGYTNII
jgi:hypothetical protein